MPINYALFENNVTADPDEHAATVQMTDTTDLDALIRRMIERGSTTTRADILAEMKDAIGACESMLLDGMRVNLGGLVEFVPRVRGVSTGPPPRSTRPATAWTSAPTPADGPRQRQHHSHTATRPSRLVR